MRLPARILSGLILAGAASGQAQTTGGSFGASNWGTTRPSNDSWSGGSGGGSDTHWDWEPMEPEDSWGSSWGSTRDRSDASDRTDESQSGFGSSSDDYGDDYTSSPAGADLDGSRPSRVEHTHSSLVAVMVLLGFVLLGVFAWRLVMGLMSKGMEEEEEGSWDDVPPIQQPRIAPARGRGARLVGRRLTCRSCRIRYAAKHGACPNCGSRNTTRGGRR